MANGVTKADQSTSALDESAALQHVVWRRRGQMSRLLEPIERFLGAAGFDRAPWLAVAFALGIAGWFGLSGIWAWLSLLALCAAVAILAAALLERHGNFPFTRQALTIVPLVIAAGCATVWAKSGLVGQPAIERPQVSQFQAHVIDREEQPSRQRVRLVLATRLQETAGPVKVRVNLPLALDDKAIVSGARIKLQARLMPPAPPMLPGGYNFARTAWFSGLTATGTVIGPVEILQHGDGRGGLRELQSRLSRHVRENIDSSSGAIAATLASGDRGAIEEADAQAMRDSGLAHLLSISGLHVSAVIAISYLLAIRILALFPWLALRVRLPVLAAAAGASAGLFYTLLTGGEVPTVRSCIGALLVLVAVALGREALSLRMLAVAAGIVLLLWPESLVGPSFQMSFAAVISIVALSQSEHVRKLLAPREEALVKRGLRYLAMLLLTGFVIEMVLMPIAFYHFHRAGVYGALANVVAIPLTTLAIMPLIGLALVLDVIGLGAPVWWLVERVLDALLALAHWVSDRPGSVTVLPAMGMGSYLLFIMGGLWLALWRSRLRVLGLLPAAIGILNLVNLDPPDILISGDGRHVGISEPDSPRLLVLRNSRSDYVMDNLTELAGMRGDVQLISQWPGATCNRDFCIASLTRKGRNWSVMVSRGNDYVPERALAAACEKVDIVISDRWLPRSCSPKWLKADRSTLSRTGGLAVNLDERQIVSVAGQQGQHGWWRGVAR